MGGQTLSDIMEEKIPTALPSASRDAALARELKDACEHITLLLAEASQLGLRVDITGEQVQPQGADRPHHVFKVEVWNPLI